MSFPLKSEKRVLMFRAEIEPLMRAVRSEAVDLGMKFASGSDE